MEGYTKRPDSDPEKRLERRNINPFQQCLGITLEELRLERRAQMLTRPWRKRK